MTITSEEKLTDSCLPDSVEVQFEAPEENEYAIFTELSESQKLKMELIEGIRHAKDRQTKTKLIKEAATILEKSTRTIRRMVTKVEQEGLAALVSTVRADRGQLRISRTACKISGNNSS